MIVNSFVKSFNSIYILLIKQTITRMIKILPLLKVMELAYLDINLGFLFSSK